MYFVAVTFSHSIFKPIKRIYLVLDECIVLDIEIPSPNILFFKICCIVAIKFRK